ncbi:uncharacterized protein LOC134813623 isoform X1 [Bolinopsis microptera]|uniref:uncharacterized protein LOC134813623 isoform X1 n=1 Tax=Bolinopsis microptera TaxID=2820187 RepID=UPI00307AEAFD
MSFMTRLTRDIVERAEANQPLSTTIPSKRKTVTTVIPPPKEEHAECIRSRLDETSDRECETPGVTPSARAWEATPSYATAMTPGHATPGAMTPVSTARRHSDMTNALATFGSKNSAVVNDVIRKYITDKSGSSLTRLHIDEVVRRTAAKESSRRQNLKRLAKRKLTRMTSAAKSLKEQRDSLNERLRMLYDEEEAMS